MSLPALEPFTGGAGALTTNWTQQRTTRTINRDGAGLGLQDAIDAGADVAAFWSGDAFAPAQYAQFVFKGATAGTNYVGLTVLAADTGDAAWDAYEFLTDGGSGAGHTELYLTVNGGQTLKRNYTTTFAANDVIKLTANGGVIEAFKNGVSIGTFSDGALTAGSPGITSFWSAATAGTFDDWEGGNLAGSVSMFWQVGTRQLVGQSGPFDPLGFLKAPVYSYVSAPIATGFKPFWARNSNKLLDSDHER